MARYLLILFLLILLSCKTDDLFVLPHEDDLSYREKPVRALVAGIFPGEDVYIGVASHYKLFGTETMDTVDHEFSYVTPANDFKQSYIHPEPGIWHWERSDAWVDHALANDQVMRLHAPISPQCSKWVKEDDRTPAELDTMLREYVTALCKTYGDAAPVRWLDVVNETIDNKTAGWFGPRQGTDKWENPWPLIGYDESVSLRPPLYIKKAFTLADSLAPSVQLIINQHGALEEPVWEKMKELVQYLRDNGLRVDGLGWQAHIDVGWEKIPGNLERLDALVKWCHDHDLAFHITEFTVWLKGDDAGRLKEQAETFTSIIKVLLDNRQSGPVAVNFWQVRSSETMHADWDGCLFDNDLHPKPAYYEVKKLIYSYR